MAIDNNRLTYSGSFRRTHAAMPKRHSGKRRRHRGKRRRKITCKKKKEDAANSLGRYSLLHEGLLGAEF